MSHEFVFYIFKIPGFDFPDINILLNDFWFSFSRSIPFFFKTIGLEDHLSPAVENKHLKLTLIDAYTLDLKVIIQSNF